MTKQIELTQGLFALVDDHLYDWLNQWRWYSNKGRNTYYALRNGSSLNNNEPSSIGMHREILGLSHHDGCVVDHINQDGLDNQRSNLRVVSNTENIRNHKLFNTSKTGHTGVTWNDNANKWHARIHVNYKYIHLGYFSCINDAIEARKQGELKHWN